MFSQTAEYALRTIVFIASRNGAPATVRELAAETRCPEGYLAKVVKALVRGGLVRAQRGPNGGSVLTRPPDQISIHDVLEAVDPIRRIRSCPLGLQEHGVKLCRLHSQLDHTLEMVEQSLKQAKVSEMIAHGNGARSAAAPLCGITRPSTLQVGIRRRKARP